MIRRRNMVVSILITLALPMHASAQNWGRYGVTVFQTPVMQVPSYPGLSGYVPSSLNNLNNQGQLVGQQYDPSSNRNLISLFTPGAGLAPLYTFGGFPSNWVGPRPITLNNVGLQAGDLYTSAQDPNVKHAFVSPVGATTVTDLGTLGGANSEAWGINDLGQVVGYSQTASDTVPGFGGGHAFLYDGGVMQDLGTFGGRYSALVNINSRGQAVGSAYTNANTFHAAFYTGGVLTDLGTLGGSNSVALSVNNSGQVVGYSYQTGDPLDDNGNPLYRAFITSGGPLQALGTFGGSESFASGISDNGFIVGHSTLSGDLIYRAALWENTPTGYAIYDFDTIINDGVTNSGWQVQTVWAISGDGRFVSAYATHGTQSGFVVLGQNDAPEPPVIATPEPLSILLLATGMIGVFGRVRQRRESSTSA